VTFRTTALKVNDLTDQPPSRGHRHRAGLQSSFAWDRVRLCLKSLNPAPTARAMTARGKRKRSEARRPWKGRPNYKKRPEGPR